MDSTPWAHTAAMLASALLGLAAGTVFGIGGWEAAVEAFLMMMLFAVFAAVDMRDVKRSFSDVRFAGTALLINFVWTPVLAWLLGLAFYSDADMRAGLLLLLVTPCTDWYLVFTRVSGGNVALAGSILPMNLVLQVLLMPVYIMIFCGSGADFDAARMLFQASYVVAIPLAAAAAVRLLSRRSAAAGRFAGFVRDRCDGIQLLFLCLAVFAMFASAHSTVTDNLGLVVSLVAPLAVFFASDYVLANYVAGRLRMPREDATALTFTTMARNSPLALAIASAVFADSPLVLVALAVGPLIELPVLSLVSSFRLRGNGGTGTEAAAEAERSKKCCGTADRMIEDGAPARDRTEDLVINSHTLYRLSYRGFNFSHGGLV